MTDIENRDPLSYPTPTPASDPSSVLKQYADADNLNLGPSRAEGLDRVLVDAPCSNTGVLRRRPDARWRWSAARLAELVALQGEILSAAARFVAPGGVLVYSTCSNEPEENEDRAAAFLAANPDFSEIARRASFPLDTGHDGAFAVAFRRLRRH